VLKDAKAKLANASSGVQRALEELSQLSDILTTTIPYLDLHIDLAEMRGYRYHTGIMFAAYTAAAGRAIAWGGRYDNTGKRLGRERGATGFSTDLKVLESLLSEGVSETDIVYAPEGYDKDLLKAINDCRKRGSIVVQELPNQVGGAANAGCNKHFVKINDVWEVKAISG